MAQTSSVTSRSLHYCPCAWRTSGLSAERVRSLTKPTVRKWFDRRTGTFSCRTYSLHNDRGCAMLEQAVWQPNALVRLPNRQFAQISGLCDARTGGVAAERVSSLAKPTVCATIVAVRRSNTRCGSRTR